ncbi:MAG: hypothetical protein QOE90_1230 [Thermoplasmata archaeon]|nr:hypothetical protein [Thermoplasmata archaeon]
MQARRVAPLAALLAVALVYVLLRPILADLVPHLGVVEYPIGAALVAGCVLLALRPRRARAPPAAPWRKHAQVVRPLPDPEAQARAAALDDWARTGAQPDRAQRILAQATGEDVAPAMGAATTERKRRALLSSLSKKISGT